MPDRGSFRVDSQVIAKEVEVRINQFKGSVRERVGELRGEGAHQAGPGPERSEQAGKEWRSPRND